MMGNKRAVSFACKEKVCEETLRAAVLVPDGRLTFHFNLVMTTFLVAALWSHGQFGAPLHF